VHTRNFFFRGKHPLAFDGRSPSSPASATDWRSQSGHRPTRRCEVCLRPRQFGERVVDVVVEVLYLGQDCCMPKLGI